jgi:hypothetical protein
MTFLGCSGQNENLREAQKLCLMKGSHLVHKAAARQIWRKFLTIKGQFSGSSLGACELSGRQIDSGFDRERDGKGRAVCRAPTSISPEAIIPPSWTMIASRAGPPVEEEGGGEWHCWVVFCRGERGGGARLGCIWLILTEYGHGGR